ncbi:wax ester/triacylglycerol synthase family O-acyltransferase [Nocardioides sp. CER19]|uniref:WS/DGAT/MGAT family O-acyltransferase n=1 Tax=Nocardioides sp. CER19 TaxID=3038538 RepID=UPI00244D7869|nr:wax ester/triacylglycerol synthase family O-acyltransferase [Nocardioides sp. CER19]MDH2415024.1 wax ester/triacylglycerol synthase family O-acyltransferase [Nocardioides sp. CER19]
MGDRLTPRDLSFLTEESATAPRQNATVEIFEPGPEGFDYDALLALIADRISFVPRYRQRVQFLPGRLANPVWVDDPTFELEYHVRRSALPRPGNADQLRDLVARIVSRPLDRHRPLWEMYLVEGLEGGRVAILTKAHQALVDGVHTVDLGQLLLDVSPDTKLLDPEYDDWRPGRAATPVGLLVDAVRDVLAEPEIALDAARSTTARLARRGRRLVRRGVGTAELVVRGRPDWMTPLNGRLSQQRRFVTLEARLDDLRAIRAVHGGTINDVVLAIVAGGLRAWLMTRPESLAGMRQVRAVVPISVIDENEEATSLGSQIAVHFVDLPVSEPSPVVRLHQVSYSFESHKATGRGVAASRLAGIAGFAPTTFHAVGSRAAAAQPGRSYHLTVTNVPGPQSARYAAGAEMVASYPVPPLVPGHALAIGVTSYHGGVSFGITTDRDLIPDADILGQCFADALVELLDTVNGDRPRAPRGRRRATAKAKGNA